MRVGFDARWHNDSGVGAYVAQLLRAIATAHGNIDLVVYEDPENPVRTLNGLPVERIPLTAPKYSISEQFELRGRVLQDRLAVFHSPFYIVPLAVACPVVVTFHDLIPFLFRIYSWPKQEMVRIGYRAAARRAQHVITVSDNTARDVRKILNVPEERITVVHNSAAECFRPMQDNNDLSCLRGKHGVQPPYVVVASARNWRTKNLEGALRALEMARAQTGTEFQTAVYGHEEGIDTVNGKGQDRWQTLNLRRLGYVDSPDLALLFRHANAFLMPSLYEGFGIPILEAMSCGCPVVTSNGGSLAEIAGSGAQVFSPKDIEGMADAVSQLLCSPEARQRWRVSALSRAADFSWEQAALQTISVYHRIRTGV
jgi:glycosyltransferase involved in cell wall biosynthesis